MSDAMRPQPASEPGKTTASDPPGVDPVIRLREAMNAERIAIQDLIRENGRLRREHQEWSVAATHLVQTVCAADPTAPLSGVAPNRAALASVGEYVRQAGQRTAEMFERDGLLRSENASLVERCQELMAENNNLFKLYVASRHLHSTLALDGVLQVISEIIQDIIGASDYAVFLHDERDQRMVPAIVKGLDGGIADRLQVGSDSGCAFLAPGEQSYVTNEPSAGGAVDIDHPLVAISLRNDRRLMGAIAIYRLLAQKPQFTDVDYALFDFFAGHAATALFSAHLFSQAEGKVKKMKEFLNMMGTS